MHSSIRINLQTTAFSCLLVLISSFIDQTLSAQASVNSVNGPSAVRTADISVDVMVNYSTTFDYDLIVNFQEDFGNFRIVSTKRTPIAATQNTPTDITVTVPVPPTWDPDCSGSDYKFDVFIVPTGGNFPPVSVPARRIQTGVTFNTLIIETAPNPVVAGSTINVTVKYNLPLTQDVNINLQQNFSPFTTFASGVDFNNFGCGTRTVPLSVPASTPPGSNYKFDAFTAPSGGDFSTRTSRAIQTGITVTAALPVELASFSGLDDQDGVLLEWSTAWEVNSDRFELEHSVDGVDFQLIHRTKSTGNEAAGSHYEYRHREAATGTNYYRLRQVDMDGQEEAFKILSVERRQSAEDGMTRPYLFPNPAVHSLTLHNLPAQEIDGAILYIHDRSGRRIQSRKLSTGSGFQVSVEVTDLPPGIYSLHLITATGELRQFSFVKE